MRSPQTRGGSCLCQRLSGLQATRTLAATRLLSSRSACVTLCQLFLGLFLCPSTSIRVPVSPGPATVRVQQARARPPICLLSSEVARADHSPAGDPSRPQQL